MDKDSTAATGPKSTGTAGATGRRGDTTAGVSHTDTARGKGGGQMTQEEAGGGDENAKDRDVRSPSGDIGGQDPDEVAERMKSTGKDLGIA